MMLIAQSQQCMLLLAPVEEIVNQKITFLSSFHYILKNVSVFSFPHTMKVTGVRYCFDPSDLNNVDKNSSKILFKIVSFVLSRRKTVM